MYVGHGIKPCPFSFAISHSLTDQQRETLYIRSHDNIPLIQVMRLLFFLPETCGPFEHLRQEIPTLYLLPYTLDNIEFPF